MEGLVAAWHRRVRVRSVVLVPVDVRGDPQHEQAAHGPASQKPGGRGFTATIDDAFRVVVEHCRAVGAELTALGRDVRVIPLGTDGGAREGQGG